MAGRGRMESTRCKSILAILSCALVSMSGALSGGDQSLLKVTSAVSNLTRITSRPEPEFAPSACPSTGDVAFTGMVWKERGRRNHYEVWIVNPAKAQHQYRRITDSEADSLWPAISPDGKKVVFASQRGDKSIIWETNSNGLGGNRLISDVPECYFTYPDVSTDGFVYCALRDQALTGPVEIDDVGRAALTTILAPPAAVYLTAQFLTVNVALGKPVYQTSMLEGKMDKFSYLWVCDIDGLNQTEFVEGYSPRCFPKTAGRDGASDKIAFTKRDADGRFHIWTVNRDGSHLTQITWGNCSDIQPSWSPDGTKLTFASNRTATGLARLLGDRDYDIWVMNADGTGLTQLTDHDKFCGHPTFATNDEIYFHAVGGFINENWDIWRVTLAK